MNIENKNAVRQDRQKRQFEMALGEGSAAFIQYEEAGEGVLALVHTEVPEDFEGQGVGSKLVRGAFEIVRGENLKIVPTCTFIATYLRRHPEYQSLVA